ncbi:MAG: ABC transporter ATP-binding protein [Hymenobacteraceae bacterium]|nr:ABC transporter ATP-binding protein [Hymenobacteraceae bacterium]MDX5395214.1 ABC transporter ATP-binding protein [Hymenobacteraceae bacterium]MDX5442764.1 ABC transporter ATP-binding protein [Hymenobacteraceae bacterium]MDX5511252.1 ABC transporter ATP-binding protein [Hymenobacteraceae bacterium]
MEPVLDIQQLSKNFGSIKAVDNLTLQVEPGSIYGLLGPNGSGKTTTLGMVLGIINPSSGNFKWFGNELHSSTKRRIGAILETPNFYPYLSAYRNLQVVAEIKHQPKQEIDKVLEMVGLHQRRKTAFKTFSLGMKQRLALASALLGNPEVLVLDEPTNGLDPEGIAEVRELIKQVAAQGKTIILASHLLDEVEKVCTHMAVLRSGKLKAAGRVNEILAAQDQVIVEVADPAAAQAILQQVPYIEQVNRQQQQLYCTLLQGYSSADVNRILFEHNIVASQVILKKKSLESQFLEIIKADVAP